MPSTLRRLRLRVTDAVRFSPLTRGGLAARAAAQAVLAGTPEGRLDAAVEGYRLAPDWPGAGRLLGRVHRAVAAGVPSRYTAALARGGAWSQKQSVLDRTLVLKAPGPGGERGVLLVFGEYNWLRLLASLEDTRAVQREYDWVLIAGWSPAEYGPLLALARAVDGPVFVEPGNYHEHRVLEALHPHLRATPTICSDWLDPARFAPRPTADKDIDVVMVANWSPYKRHWHLFQTLARMDPGLRVTLIGQPNAGHDLAGVRRQAADFGVPQAIEFLENPATTDVHDRLARARAAVIFSRREGPCVVVAEAMFCNTPVGLLAGAHVGTVAHVNPQTGRLLSGRLDRELARLIADSATFHPRAWAESHISCHHSIASLNRCLRESAEARGLPWTRDLVTYHWRPYPAYLRPDDEVGLAPFRDALCAAHPALFGPATFG